MSSGSKTQTTTSSSGVPDYLQGDVKQAFGKATAAANAGDLSHVQGHSENEYNQDGSVRSQGQKEFLQETSQDGLAGATQQQLAALQGQQLTGSLGNAASARQDRANAAGLADASAKFAGQNLQVKNQAHQELQQQGQLEGDATHQGLQRQFGYFGSGAAGSQSTNTAPKSGGK